VVLALCEYVALPLLLITGRIGAISVLWLFIITHNRLRRSAFASLDKM
jgi:Trk-type K+ transport system membrane component